MLDPDVVLDAVVSTLRSIPTLVSELGGTDRITGHKYLYGPENSLMRAIFAMRSPSILVAYTDLRGGNWSGTVMWKHRLEINIRPGNANTNYQSYLHLCWLVVNGLISGTNQNIRQVALLNGDLFLVETPSLAHKTDENFADFFTWSFVFPEHGDQ